MKLTPIKVNLGERSYFIHFNGDWAEILAPYNQRSRLIVSDENVAAGHLRRWESLSPGADTIVVPPGEKSKSPETLNRIHTFMIERGFDREALILALGGGMIGDLAGFAAATFMRGVDIIQIPTSLLAMVDAAIGGKTGIDHPLGKNLIGAFHQPQAVLTDTAHLKTLPRREWLCGLGEVLKYGIIADTALFDRIAERMSRPPEQWITPDDIRRCAQVKAEIVARDERETSGERAVLNLGHTIGHALEAAAGYSALKHGEAVAAGLAGAAHIARKRNFLPPDQYERILAALRRFPFPRLDRPFDTAEISAFIHHDKKRRQGKVRFVLPCRIGEVCLVDDIIESEIASALEFTLEFIRGKS